jgi:DNA-binding LacI/PurR family transcriptional regulator
MQNSNEIIFQRLLVDEKQDNSIAAQIADQIHWLIATCQLNPGDKLPPVRELASHLRINLHTVRAAYHRLEENRMISIRRGVGAVVLDYKPSDAVSANSMPTHTFGVIVPDLGNPFYPEFLSGAARVAQQQHVLLITSDTQNDHSLGKAHFETLLAKKVDGMLVGPWGLSPDQNEAFKGDYHEYPIPLVFIDQPHIEGYAVLLDSKNAGLLATQHLIEHGHKSIAMITGSLAVPTLNEVYQGYRLALKNNGIEFHPQIVIEADGFSYSEGYHAAKLLIESGNLPEALFAAGDLYAVGAMKALRENRIRVPEDVAVIGYNNIDVANYTIPTLTSVSTPIYDLGVRSAELLLKLVSREPVEREKLILPSRLIVRESCGCKIDEKAACTNDSLDQGGDKRGQG